MINAWQENARMLASALGIDEDAASARLEGHILITVSECASCADWAREICDLLDRTMSVTWDPADDVKVELVVGDALPRSVAKRLYARIDASKAVIGLEPPKVASTEPHPLFAAIAACSAAAATLSLAIDAEGLPKVSLPITVLFDQLGISREALAASIDLDGTALIGAGAVGNAFLRALRHVDARGTLPIVDPKTVGGGNPNRCLYFTEADVEHPKAETLARNASPDFPHVALTAFNGEFHDYVAKNGPQRTAIVTVDSRRVRRAIQAEVPGRVFDASTTDIRAVVVHSHRQPTANACLSCIYRHVPDEHARERAIAEGLGISLDMVRESLISADAAALIARANAGIQAAAIEGMAYDSLFKQLCAEQALKSTEGKQVLAPFAFVSALAGGLLVIEMLRVQAGFADTNYWQINPWSSPIGRLRSCRPRATDCEFCSVPHFVAIANQLWMEEPKAA
ncbi:hypothetical protein AYR46_16520 [Sphingobium yanoikuyae]|nr:hypothetical protein AYR46_16520 [Sphingobium yanoikuyae]